MKKHTQIIATIGPACADEKTLTAMVKAGMNMARLNFSHGDYKEFKEMIKNIRKVAKKLKTEVAIMQDLQGPKIRIGRLPEEGLLIKENEKFVLSTKSCVNKVKCITLKYKGLPHDVKKGDTILIDDGLFECEVTRKTKEQIFCTAKNKWRLMSNKGIAVPSASISKNPLTEKDLRDLDFGLKNKVDYVALSFVRDAKDVKKLKKLIKKQKSKTLVIAKIERHEAMKNLKKIVKKSDMIMVARGDLGVDMEPEMLPILQKQIIAECKKQGKPVIVATQILQSMINSPQPTRAEISDAATAVFEEADALMLSNETAVGKYPVKAVKTLSKVAANVERALKN